MFFVSKDLNCFDRLIYRETHKITVNFLTPPLALWSILCNLSVPWGFRVVQLCKDKQANEVKRKVSDAN